MSDSSTVFRLLALGCALGAGGCSNISSSKDSAGDADQDESGTSEDPAEEESSSAEDSDSASSTGGADSTSTSSTSSTSSTGGADSTSTSSTTSGGSGSTTTGDPVTTDETGVDPTGTETTGDDTSSEMGNPSPGCGSMTARPDPREQQTIQVGGLTRYYLMYVPENRDPERPLPLVFGIHGLNMNNVWAAHDESGFQLIETTRDQAILIYPQGIRADGRSDPPSSQSQWGDADSNWGGPPPTADPTRIAADLAYFDALVEYATENYCIDLDRIFAMGFSQGGFMTNTLGCERPDVFRGLAPVAGWGPHASSPSCSNASAAHAVIQVQGNTDGTVTPQLGQATRDFWRMRAGCSGDTVPSSWGPSCVEYQGCGAETPVVYCTHDGGHFVPGGSGERAWNFFQSLE